MRDHIQPMARGLGINKRIGWHTLRHTFSTLLNSNGEEVKVLQELLRHSTSRMTLDTYAGFEPGQEGGTEPGGGDDSAKNSLYRRCTAGNRPNRPQVFEKIWRPRPGFEPVLPP
jgi:hypothetical protein